MRRWCPKGCGKTVTVFGFGANTQLRCVVCACEWAKVQEYEDTYDVIEVVY